MKYFIIATHHTRIKCILKKIYGINEKVKISNLGLVFIRPDGNIDIINTDSMDPIRLSWNVETVATSQQISLDLIRDMTIILIRHGYGQHNRDKDRWKFDPTGAASFIVKYFNYMYHEPRLVLDKNNFTLPSHKIQQQLRKNEIKQIYYCSSPMIRCIQTISCIRELIDTLSPRTFVPDKRIYILPNIHEIGGLNKCKQSLNSWWAMAENRSQLSGKTNQQRQKIENQVLSKTTCPSENLNHQLPGKLVLNQNLEKDINWAPFNNLSSSTFLYVLHLVAAS